MQNVHTENMKGIDYGAGVKAKPKRKSKKALNDLPLFYKLLLNLIFIAVTITCLWPILLAIGISFTDEASLMKDGYNVIPRQFSFDAYNYLFTNLNQIMNAYKTTIFNTVTGVLLSVMMIAFYAYPLSRKDFKYRKFFTFLIFVTMIFNGGMVPWYLVCSRILHLQNTVWAMIIPYLFSAWYVIILRTFFTLNIPDSLIEAAKIDGAGEFLIFFKLILPLSLPGIATIALFQTLGYWNDWWLPLMLVSKPELSNLQFLLYRILTNVQVIAENSAYISGEAAKVPTESVRMAICIVAIGPIILAYPFFQRYFIQGLTVGAIKG